MNETKLELKKRSTPVHHPVNPIIIHPHTGVISRFIHILGLDTLRIEELSLPDRRRASNEAQNSKDIFVGTAMIYVKRDR